MKAREAIRRKNGGAVANNEKENKGLKKPRVTRESARAGLPLRTDGQEHELQLPDGDPEEILRSRDGPKVVVHGWFFKDRTRATHAERVAKDACLRPVTQIERDYLTAHLSAIKRKFS